MQAFKEGEELSLEKTKKKYSEVWKENKGWGKGEELWKITERDCNFCNC